MNALVSRYAVEGFLVMQFTTFRISCEPFVNFGFFFSDMFKVLNSF